MKQHPLCSDCENKITPMDLPIPSGLKKEWAASESRRQFLGRTGKGSWLGGAGKSFR